MKLKEKKNPNLDISELKCRKQSQRENVKESILKKKKVWVHW